MTKIALEPITIPGGLFDQASFIRVLRNVRAARAKDIKIDFDVTAQTWTNAPKAKIQHIGDTEAIITMNDDRYVYVNDGTRPHDIRPRNAPRLRFQTGYKPKTVVRQIASRSGGSFGPTVYSLGVRHPGTEGRHFDDEIAKKWNRLLPDIVGRAILAELG